MITTCKEYIRDGVTRIWDHSHSELKKRINDCIRLNEAYQSQYWKTKQKLQETPSERQFDFRSFSFFYMFMAFDLCKRHTNSSSVSVNTGDTLRCIWRLQVFQ